MSVLVSVLAGWRGVARSLRVYRLDRAHAAGLRAFYRPFLRPGDLAFDVGAHVGDRTAAFRALGARVVAVEPQARLMRALRMLHGRDRGVTLVRAALGAAEGETVLRVNTANPTVSTLSGAFTEAAEGAAGWEGQRWDATETVPLTTLDALIARHGRPAFVKIDVEGFEAAVLAGLSQPPPALSFEVVAAARGAGLAALARARALGYGAFRLSLGEGHVWAGDWIGGAAMAAALAAMPDAANSGDVYCRG
ncbi:MAG: FkbM family methyltransferase [Rhodobacterales bacterium CG_4_10_14_0_8_um_filter_70_9]|nr:MAG: FkbM family methyltransferase [Rhodobacterales bacterium CG_4_10_14_0_8_um_filter_70_9]